MDEPPVSMGQELPAEFWSLFHRLREVALEPTLEEPPDVLYHYTDENGLRGILGSGHLWATALKCLEDKKEILHPVEVCRDYLRRRRRKESGVRKKFVKAVYHFGKEVDEIAHCLHNQAATCLSKEIHVRIQWERYAAGGHGYALGLSKEGLMGLLWSRLGDPNSQTDINWSFRAMVYDPKKQRQLLGKILQEIFMDPLFHDPGSDDVANAITGAGVYALALAAAQFKRQQFVNEHELRITIANQRELNLARTELRVKQRDHVTKGTIEYMEVDLRHPKTGLMPVVEIVAGPEADVDAATEAVASAEDMFDKKPIVRKMESRQLR